MQRSEDERRSDRLHRSDRSPNPDPGSAAGSTRPQRGKRPITIGAVVLALAAVAVVAQNSFAGDRRAGAPTACPTGGVATTTAGPTAAGGPLRSYQDRVAADNNTDVHHVGDGATVHSDRRWRTGGANCPTPATGGGSGNPPALTILGDDCGTSRLRRHDGFQNGGRCVGTEFGEVGTAASNPTLLITSAPGRVRVNQPFSIRVSTRNLVRDRFLAAGQGGYYKESSFLNAQGLVRGHFHTACRQLNRRLAPDPAPVPAFFLATEDGKGNSIPDEVKINIPGIAAAGLYQCAAWAGDGSHRVPMMERANQIPAFDSVRIFVSDR